MLVSFYCLSVFWFLFVLLRIFLIQRQILLEMDRLIESQTFPWYEIQMYCVVTI